MKKLIWAAMLPLAFAACTNEDAILNEAPVVEGDLITLEKSFALGVTKGATSSRAQYDGTFKSWEWMPTLTSENEIDEVDKVGLSWIQGTDGKVYTNYEFQHFAWPVKDMTPKIDDCTSKWTNMVFLTQEDYNANSDETNDYVTAWDGTPSVTPTTVKTPVETEGYFKTANLSIFTGDYIIYSPYNPSLNKVDYLKATAKDVFELNAVKLGSYGNENDLKKATQGLGNEVFYVGSAEIEGGSTVNGFNLYPVTGMVELKIALGDRVSPLGKDIKKVAIFAKDGIVVEQAIDASKVKDNLKGCLIADATKTSSAVLVDLKEAITIESQAYSLYVPMLPQTVKDAKVVLFAEDGSSVLVNAGDIEVGFGSYKAVNLTLTAADKLQTETYYVIDMATFRSAMVSAGTSGKTTATINLLNDITYDDAYCNENGKIEVVNDMTICGNDIIVPAGENMVLKLMNDGNLTMDGNVVIEKGCCGLNAASVRIFGMDVKKNAFVFNGEVSNNGIFTVGTASAAANTKVTFNDKFTNAGELDVLSYSEALVSFEELENAEEGEVNLIDKKEVVGSVVTSVESFVNEGAVNVGAYTKLNITESLTNDGEITIVTSGTGANSTDGTVVIETAAKATNNGTINNRGVYDNNGSTTLTAGSEFIDFVGSQWGDNMPTVNDGAEYICEVNSSVGERFGYALGTKMPTTTVRFVSGSTHDYQLKDYATLAKLATVKYIVAVDETVDFIFRNAAAGEITLGTSLVVESVKSLKFNGGKTKVNGDVTVNAGEISNNGLGNAKVAVAGNLVMNNSVVLNVKALKDATAATELTTPSWTVGKNVDLNGTSRMEVEADAAVDFNGNLTIAEKAFAVFNANSYSDIAGTITNNGTFNRVLSSKADSDANPAQVWCTKYVNNGTQVNGAAQVSK